jgi:hypothetical protein
MAGKASANPALDYLLQHVLLAEVAVNQPLAPTHRACAADAAANKVAAEQRYSQERAAGNDRCIQPVL